MTNVVKLPDPVSPDKCQTGDPGTITTADGDVLNVGGPCENTDREIWRGPDEGNGDFYADSLHITKGAALGIDCGGYVCVKPIREWHKLAGSPTEALRKALEEIAAMDPKGVRADDLGRAARVATAALSLPNGERQ